MRVGHAERPDRQAPGPFHDGDRGCPRARGRAGACARGPEQAVAGLGGHDRSAARPRTQAPPSEGAGRDEAGRILKRQIPIRTFAQWDDRRPGFCEVDLVAHDGGNPAGEFCQTLTLTCVNTGGPSRDPCAKRPNGGASRPWSTSGPRCPSPLLGLDSDNGSEFINTQLFSYCEQESITFTRSRPERKNDNCYVEQKNWTVVRQQVGYARYDTAEELAVLAELYRHLRLYVNFFQPHMRLVEKVRQGAKVSRRYDRARTPYQRVLDTPLVDEDLKQELTRIYLGLNPAQLKRDLGACQDRLMMLAAHKPYRGKEVTRPPSTFLYGRGLSRTLLMRQRMAASRTS